MNPRTALSSVRRLWPRKVRTLLTLIYATLFFATGAAQVSAGPRDGVGLRLSIARSVAAAHQATVTARSKPGGGLDVAVVMPRAVQS